MTPVALTVPPVALKLIALVLLGITLEVCFTGAKALVLRRDVTAPGHTSLWMLPGYALGGAVFEAVRTSGYGHWLVYLLLIYFIEALYGRFLHSLLGSNPWEYRSGWHFRGLIRLDYAPFWLCVAVSYNRVGVFLDLLSSVGTALVF